MSASWERALVAAVARRDRQLWHDPSLETLAFSWYGLSMDTTPFDLTPEQKGMLLSLSRETGKSIPALIAQALEDLQEHECAGHTHGETDGHEVEASAPQEASKPIWEQFIEASLDIPDEELDRLPTDGAAQHDHYISGTPKRPV